MTEAGCDPLERRYGVLVPDIIGRIAVAIIDVLPAYPIITAPVATAVTGRAKAAIYDGVEQLANAGVLLPLTASKRNRSWEASGLFDLIERLEAGELPV